MTQGTGNTDQKGLELLRKILLSQERTEIAKVKNVIEDPIELNKKVEPIIEEQLEKMRENFPTQYKKTVQAIVQKELKSSQTEIMNAIYPVMGTMIKKFITLQFQQLKESIDQQIKGTFSNKGILGRIKGNLFGSKTADEILVSIDKLKIEEVFVVERNSGLLIGAASNKPTVNHDMIAGMLTAIKSFVEDAFMEGAEDLDLIEYDTLKLYIQNFPSYFVVVAIKGSVSAQDKEDLMDRIFKFAEKILLHKVLDWNEEDFNFISRQLDLHFILGTQ